MLTLIVRSAEPVTNHSFEGSNAIDRTHPICPEITALSSQGACQRGVGTRTLARFIRAIETGSSNFLEAVKDKLWPTPGCKELVAEFELEVTSSPEVSNFKEEEISLFTGILLGTLSATSYDETFNFRLIPVSLTMGDNKRRLEKN
jgi:hypothetical protein